MLTMQNPEKVQGDAEVASALTSWNSLPLNNAHEEEMLLLEWYFMVGATHTFSVGETFHFPCRKDSTIVL